MKLTLFLCAVFLVYTVSCRTLSHDEILKRYQPEIEEEDPNSNDVFAVDRVRPEVGSSFIPVPQDSEIGQVFTKEFLRFHEKFAKECRRFGCKICVGSESRFEESCQSVPSTAVHGRRPWTSMTSLTGPKMTVQAHGFMEARLHYKNLDGSEKTFKIRLMQILDGIKMIMMAKDAIQSCVPQLLQYELKSNQSIPSLSVQSFMADDGEEMGKFWNQVWLNGGNFCLGPRRPDASNCFSSHWEATQCHAFTEDRPTLTVHRRADQLVLSHTSVPDENSETAKTTSIRIEKRMLDQNKRLMNLMRALLANHPDPSVEQLFELRTGAMDFLSEHAFAE